MLYHFLTIFLMVEGLQWVMHYYYSGVTLWGWFYNYHDVSHISSVFLLVLLFCILMQSSGLKMSFNFHWAHLFTSTIYKQFMGVLPLANKDQIPSTFHVWKFHVFQSTFWCSSLTGFDVWSEFANPWLLPIGFWAESQWEETRLGSYHQNSIYGWKEAPESDGLQVPINPAILATKTMYHFLR